MKEGKERQESVSQTDNGGEAGVKGGEQLGLKKCRICGRGENKGLKESTSAMVRSKPIRLCRESVSESESG